MQVKQSAVHKPSLRRNIDSLRGSHRKEATHWLPVGPHTGSALQKSESWERLSGTRRKAQQTLPDDVVEGIHLSMEPSFRRWVHQSQNRMSQLHKLPMSRNFQNRAGDAPPTRWVLELKSHVPTRTGPRYQCQNSSNRDPPQGLRWTSSKINYERMRRNKSSTKRNLGRIRSEPKSLCRTLSWCLKKTSRWQSSPQRKLDHHKKS